MTIQSNSHSPVILALDYAQAQPALALVQQLNPQHCRLKVGKELFVAAGPDFVRQLVDQGFDVFLDLKFHDIPNTTAKACVSAAKLGVWMVNVHASGGVEMMQTAKQALQEADLSPLLIGVTVLTSMNQNELTQLGIQRSLDQQVQHLAGLVQQAGLDGVVCSAQEASLLKADFGQNFQLITPGIRPLTADAQDQKRIVTPTQAIANGSDYLVIGRPITQATDPVHALAEINHSLGLSV